MIELEHLLRRRGGPVAHPIPTVERGGAGMPGNVVPGHDIPTGHRQGTAAGRVEVGRQPAVLVDGTARRGAGSRAGRIGQLDQAADRREHGSIDRQRELRGEAVGGPIVGDRAAQRGGVWRTQSGHRIAAGEDGVGRAQTAAWIDDPVGDPCGRSEQSRAVHLVEHVVGGSRTVDEPDAGHHGDPEPSGAKQLEPRPYLAQRHSRVRRFARLGDPGGKRLHRPPPAARQAKRFPGKRPIRQPGERCLEGGWYLRRSGDRRDRRPRQRPVAVQVEREDAGK